jgi:hypothetical protein
MTLIKKRDVKDYFASRRLKGGSIHTVPASKPSPTDLPKKEGAPIKDAPSGFDQDFRGDHSSSGAPLSSGGRPKSPKTAKTPAALGRKSL